MERLTERTAFGIVGNNKKVTNYPLYKVAEYDKLDHGIIGQCFEKLASYEDAEEQGLLLMLPCNVGDTVYLVQKYHKPSLYELKVIDIILRDNEFYFDLVDICDEEYSTPISTDDFGKCVFLTREEAEKALADMGV